jgi:hypothetical protein
MCHVSLGGGKAPTCSDLPSAVDWRRKIHTVAHRRVAEDTWSLLATKNFATQQLSRIMAIMLAMHAARLFI